MDEDDVLALRHLSEEQARVFERLIHSQADADKLFRSNVVLESDFGQQGSLEVIHGVRKARWVYGAGGGCPRHHELVEPI